MKRLLLAGAAIVLLSACGSGEVEREQANCARLKQGMSESEVLAIMGPPRSQYVTDFPKAGKSLEYSEGVMASGPLTVQLSGSGENLSLEYALCHGVD
jgi:hypothetical protein